MFYKELFKPDNTTKNTFTIIDNAYFVKSLDPNNYNNILSELKRKYRHLDSHISYIFKPNEIDICILCNLSTPTLFMLVDTPIKYRAHELYRKFIFRGSEFTVTSTSPNIALLKHIDLNENI